MKQNYWFIRKTYGWGWTPANWKGWLTLLVWLLALVISFRIIDINSHSVSNTLYGILVPWILITLLCWAICWLKGEKLRW